MGIIKILQESSTPGATATYTKIYLDSADSRIKGVRADGTIEVISDIGRHSRNFLVNGGFEFAQRQAPGTLTTYSNTTGRTYAADYWTITNENASAQYARVNADTPVTGLTARYYGQFKKITSTGKIIVAQALEASDIMALRGRRVRLQLRARNNVGSHTLRVGILQLTSSGTVDTIPSTFLSAFGAASTDPTWGTNLSAITPTLANANSSISGSALSCVLTSTFQRFGGVFTIPTTCLNLVPVIFTNGQPVANDIFEIGEAGLFDGDEERDWLPLTCAEELARCQRRCSKTFNVDTAPAQNAGTATGEERWQATSAGATTQRRSTIGLPVRMRAAPTITTYNPSNTNAQVREVSQSADCTSTTIQAITERGFNVICTGVAGTAANDQLYMHWLAEDNF